MSDVIPLTPSKTTLKHSQMHHGIYIMQCIWQPFWILQERIGISFNFWIIRLVNNQSEFYSQVRCYPFWHPLTYLKHPQNTPTWQLQISTMKGSYLPGVICYIVVKADLGRTPCRSALPGNRAKMPSIPVHQSQQTNLLWPMDPPG